MKTTEQLHVRDPFILPEGGRYYMYCRTGQGYGCHVSDDLARWSDEPTPIFEADGAFPGYTDFWAPECHKYGGRFYLFATTRSRETGHRGVAVFSCDTPDGRFVVHSNGNENGCYLTPSAWDAIDGTLWVEDGEPYMVFVHEWTCMPDKVGDMSAVRLTRDLAHTAGAPFPLFRATDPAYIGGQGRYPGGIGVTDGPFLLRAPGCEKLYMIWSTFNDSGYVEMVAVSESGKVAGPWTHEPRPLFEAGMVVGGRVQPEGGHGMIFRGADGVPTLVLHSPNSAQDGAFEHPVYIPLEIDAKGIRVRG